MRKLIALLALSAAASGSVRAGVPSIPPAPATLTVHAAAWDMSWKAASDKEWAARVAGTIASAVKDGADVVVFPEGFARERSVDWFLPQFKEAAQGRLVVLGSAPAQGPEGTSSRTYILADGAWQGMDKLDPTFEERSRKPPVKPGIRLILFRYRGGLVAALPASTIQKTEIAYTLRKRGVQLVLVSAPAGDEEAAARVARCASGRAVELGAAVVVAPPSPAEPVLYLPAQKTFDLKPQAPNGRDFRLPWKKLLELRSQPGVSTEERPFLDAPLSFQTEI